MDGSRLGQVITATPLIAVSRIALIVFCIATVVFVTLDVTLPLIRHGLLASWLLIFMIFEREYSTAVYLLNPGTEVIGSLLVSLWATGGADMVAALSFINVVLVSIGLGVALRFGVKLHD